MVSLISNTNTLLKVKTVLFLTIQFSISTQFFFVNTKSNDQTILFQIIQFSMTTN